MRSALLSLQNRHGLTVFSSRSSHRRMRKTYVRRRVFWRTNLDYRLIRRLSVQNSTSGTRRILLSLKKRRNGSGERLPRKRVQRFYREKIFSILSDTSCMLMLWRKPWIFSAQPKDPMARKTYSSGTHTSITGFRILRQRRHHLHSFSTIYRGKKLVEKRLCSRLSVRKQKQQKLFPTERSAPSNLEMHNFMSKRFRSTCSVSVKTFSSRNCN